MSRIAAAGQGKLGATKTGWPGGAGLRFGVTPRVREMQPLRSRLVPSRVSLSWV